MLETRPVAPSELAAWDSLVDSTAGGCIYLKSDWATLINTHYGSGQAALIGVFSGPSLIGGICGLSRQRLKRETLVMPLLTLYGGPLIGLGADPQVVIDEIITYLGKFGLVHLIAHPGFEYCDPFPAAGYRVGLRQTYYLSLEPSDDQLWSRFENNVQRNIRKAGKANFILSATVDVDQATLVFEAPFARRRSSSGVGSKFLRAVVSGPEIAPYRKTFAAYDGDQLISFIIWLRSGTTAYYAVAATLPDYLSTGVSSLLIWNSILELRADGAKTIDFAGANIPTIAAFKARFGCDLVSYPVLHRIGSRRIRIALALRSLLSRIRSAG